MNQNVTRRENWRQRAEWRPLSEWRRSDDWKTEAIFQPKPLESEAELSEQNEDNLKNSDGTRVVNPPDFRWLDLARHNFFTALLLVLVIAGIGIALIGLDDGWMKPLGQSIYSELTTIGRLDVDGEMLALRGWQEWLLKDGELSLEQFRELPVGFYENRQNFEPTLAYKYFGNLFIFCFDSQKNIRRCYAAKLPAGEYWLELPRLDGTPSEFWRAKVSPRESSIKWIGFIYDDTGEPAASLAPQDWP